MSAILSVMNLEAGAYQKGKTKVFIRAPETLFALEELRERKVYSYANNIQRFFQQFSMNNYYYNMQMSANQKVKFLRNFFNIFLKFLWKFMKKFRFM